MAGCEHRGGGSCPFMPGKLSMILELESPGSKRPCSDCFDPAGGSTVICE